MSSELVTIKVTLAAARRLRQRTGEATTAEAVRKVVEREAADGHSGRPPIRLAPTKTTLPPPVRFHSGMMGLPACFRSDEHAEWFFRQVMARRREDAGSR